MCANSLGRATVSTDMAMHPSSAISLACCRARRPRLGLDPVSIIDIGRLDCFDLAGGLEFLQALGNDLRADVTDRLARVMDRGAGQALDLLGHDFGRK